jgi:hypothetical protein
VTLLSLSGYDGKINCHLLFFSDKAWFHSYGEADSQNSTYWSSQNPRHEVPLILEQLVEKDCYIIITEELNINIQEDGCGHNY